MRKGSSPGAIMFGATLAGIGGVLSGWALFLLVVEESGHVWQLLAALLIAGLVALSLEYFRETIREGHSEIEKFSFLPAGIGIVTLVIVCELFVKANEHIPKIFSSLPAVHAALIGTDAGKSQLNPWWTLTGLVGIWVYMGVAAARWLTGMIQGDFFGSSDRLATRVMRGAMAGAVAALVCALFSLIGLLSFRLFVILADSAEFYSALSQIGELHRLPPWVVPFTWLMKFWHYLLNVLGDWKFDAWWGLGWRAVPAAVLVLGLLTIPFYLRAIARDEGWNSITPKGFQWIAIALVLWILIAPLVWQQPWMLAMFPLRAISIWLIPCLILGAMIPLLESAADRIGRWLGIALAISAILLVAVSIWQREFGGLVLGSIFLALSLLGFSLQAKSPTFQSLLPVFMAIVMLGPHGLWIQATRGFMGNWQTLVTTRSDSKQFKTSRWTYRSALDISFGEQKSPEAIVSDLDEMQHELKRCLESLEQLDETEKELTKFFEGHEKHDPDTGQDQAIPKSLPHVENEHDQAIAHDPSNEQANKQADGKSSVHKPIFESVNEFNWVVDNLSVQFQPLFNDIETYLTGVRSDYGPLGNEQVIGTEPLVNNFLRMLSPEIPVAAGQIQTLVKRLQQELEHRQAELEQRRPKLQRLADQASLKLSQWLEQCVSAAFGFWVTLALLATWRRLQP